MSPNSPDSANSPSNPSTTHASLDGAPNPSHRADPTPPRTHSKLGRPLIHRDHTDPAVDPRAAREQAAHHGELIRLSDARTFFADKKQDIRGRKVFDSHGHELGTIDRLLLDNDQHHVRMMQVHTRTGFLGLHRHTATIPVDTITRVEAEAVYIDRSRQAVEAAPKLVYDPKLLDKRTLQGVYEYYGYAPFWDPFYVAPLFHSHHHTPTHLNHHH